MGLIQPLVQTQTTESRAGKLLREIFESGRPLTYVRSTEEQRVARVLREVSLCMNASAPLPVWTWSLTEGLRARGRRRKAGAHDPRAALDFIDAHAHPAIFHLKDFHEPLRDSPEIRRRLRDCTRKLSRPAQVRRHQLAGPLHPGGNRAQRPVSRTAPARSWSSCAEFLRGEAHRPPSEASCGNSSRGALQGLTLDEARYALRRAQAASAASRARVRPAPARGEARCWSTAAASSNSSPTARSWARSAASTGSRSGCWSAASSFRCATA